MCGYHIPVEILIINVFQDATLGRHHEGYEHYRKALSYWKGEDRLESNPLVADMFTNIGMYDSAAYYLEQERLINPDYDNDATLRSAPVPTRP